MERCNSYKPWFDRKKNRAKLLPTDGKCLHYYFGLGRRSADSGGSRAGQKLGAPVEPLHNEGDRSWLRPA
jgi:hypothetical protein